MVGFTNFTGVMRYNTNFGRDNSVDGDRDVVTGFVRQVERCVGMYDRGEVMSKVSNGPG